MKKRIKDLAFELKIKKDRLIHTAEILNTNELELYFDWDEPKRDELGNPRFDEDGILLTRPINAPVDKLKKIQSRLLRKVLYKIKLPEYYFGGIKGKDAVLNARHHQGNKFFFLTDLKDFYTSISSKKVEWALRKEGFYPDVARLITRLCTRGGCIPQGCPTSSFLASLVLHHKCFDIFKTIQEKGLKVSIYVDDITISSPSDFKGDTMGIINQIRYKGIKINFKKTKYCSFNPLVTGVNVKNNGISAPRYNYERLKQSTRSEASRDGYKQRINYIRKIAKSN